jgi:periplasmic protein TonB
MMNIRLLFRCFLMLACLVIGISALAQTPENPCVNANGKVLHVGDGVTAPRVTFKKEPVAPEEKNGKPKYEGITILSAVIGSDGNVCAVRVVRSSRKDLDEKALETVKQWKFKPAEKKGKPVAVELNLEVEFHLYK